MTLGCSSRRALASCGVVLLLVGCGGDSSPRPHVLLISIDTLRADRLGCYGYERDTSPNLDVLAAAGVVFEHAYAPSPSTVPSHATLFTGRMPSQHRMFDFKTRLPEAERTLAEVLGEAGYRTFSVASSARFHEGSGFAQGFDEAVLVDDLPKSERSAAAIDAVLERLTAADTRPLFGFVHLFDPHEPYAPPEHERRRWHDGLVSPIPEMTSRYVQLHRKPGQQVPEETLAYLGALYDAEIRTVDVQLGRLMSALREAGIAQDVLLVLTSDHGEEFKEHGGLSHSHSLYEELLHVPLVMHGPAWLPSGLGIDSPTSLADIVPTVLDLLDVQAPPYLGGRSMRSLWEGGAAEEHAVVLGQRGEGHWSIRAELPTGCFKLIVEEGRRPLLFRLDDDPGEQRDVLEAHAREASHLLDRLAARAAQLRALGRADGEVAEVSEDLRARLIEIGYLDEIR